MDSVMRYGDIEVLPGKPLPFGATVIGEKTVNFSVFSLHATSCKLVLFKKYEKEPFLTIPFPEEFKIGNIFTLVLKNIDYEDIEYGYTMDGPFSPTDGHWFDPSHILLDPYAKCVGGRDVWGEEPDWFNPFQHRGRIVNDDYDWDGDKSPGIAIEDLIIYEMHVRGFTRHNSSNVKYPGTYRGLIEKIPYLKELGVNCIELMPIFEFDEFFKIRGPLPNGRHKLKNYWGYDPIAFFSPKAGYSYDSSIGKNHLNEFKDLVKELHKNNIEIILDVVFNHTGESNEFGPSISFRGIDNKTYYMVDSKGDYYDYTGCYNTFNCNHPIVRELIITCLRYWVFEYHIDGFRFDLASVLVRGQNGRPLEKPPLIESIAHDPVLGKCKLIAEAWDAAGLYQVGSFPHYFRFSEWNGKYRDDIRKFVKGDEGMVSTIVNRIQGSPDLYNCRGPKASINFVTCHDGFTLMDLFSYSTKNNEANCEDNRDGTNDNFSWNCGYEGETTDEEVIKLRKKLIKNCIGLLMISQGVPMILAGDEMGRTQKGNNNAYCQDNDISWIDWNLLKKNADLFNFFKKMIEFRKFHSILRSPVFLENRIHHHDGKYPEISFHGIKAWHVDYSYFCRTLAVMFNGKHSKDDIIYVAMNMHWEKHEFSLPRLSGMQWTLFADTAKQYPEDIFGVGNERLLSNQNMLVVEPRSIIILVGKRGVIK